MTLHIISHKACYLTFGLIRAEAWPARTDVADFSSQVFVMSGPSVALYCGDNPVAWAPPSLYTGIGGSEEAAIHMASALQRVGCQVVVYGKPPGDSAREYHGVPWMPYRCFAQGFPGDIFIAWRDAEYLRLSVGWKHVYHWLHNRQENPYPFDLVQRVDRILLVSKHHASDAGLAYVPRRKLYSTSNGLAPAFLREPGQNEAHRAIYASCPARGLLTTLDMWPRIRRCVPTAHLDIYHGFDPIYEYMARFFPGLRAIKRAVLRRIDESEGVTFHGMVGQDHLAEGFARAGVWLYPTETPETSCITAMKALAMGCLPVTSGFGALTETLGGRDLGPTHPSKPISKSKIRLWKFRCQVVKAMQSGNTERVRETRLEWSRWARERYSWEQVACDWRRLFDEVAAEKTAQRAATDRKRIKPVPAAVLSNPYFAGTEYYGHTRLRHFLPHWR
jgi:glycosyltransferase involved in cell wall biosynthesis